MGQSKLAHCKKEKKRKEKKIKNNKKIAQKERK
jgi:hypothetical protein